MSFYFIRTNCLLYMGVSIKPLSIQGGFTALFMWHFCALLLSVTRVLCLNHRGGYSGFQVMDVIE